MKHISYIYKLLFLFYITSLLNYHYNFVSPINSPIFNQVFHSKFKNKKLLFLVIFTSNVYEEIMNFYLSSIKKFYINDIIFLSLDYDGYYKTYMMLPNVFMAYINQNITQHIDYGTKLYWKVVYSKTDYVRLFLIRGFDIILCDTDLNLLKDPRNYILKYNTDLVASCDHRCPSMNSGF